MVIAPIDIILEKYIIPKLLKGPEIPEAQEQSSFREDTAMTDRTAPPGPQDREHIEEGIEKQAAAAPVVVDDTQHQNGEIAGASAEFSDPAASPLNDA